jgi:HCOMODA/2-hydroxy-3-carboxy-muconic semialdehyde decarboxylase
MTDLDRLRYELAVANRILAREGVVDAFGHVSVRHPEHPDRYILSYSRSPEIVGRADLIEHTLEGQPVDDGEGRPLYVERPIHGAIYEARPDVTAVVHNHSHAVIPFGVTGTPLRPILHVAGGIGAAIPVWDIHDRFGDTNLLVTTMEQGRSLAGALDEGKVALMRGHGCVVAAGSLGQAVMTAIYLQVNAALLLASLQLGEVTQLSAGEVAACAEMAALPLVAERTWEYWKARADLEGV